MADYDTPKKGRLDHREILELFHEAWEADRNNRDAVGKPAILIQDTQGVLNAAFSSGVGIENDVIEPAHNQQHRRMHLHQRCMAGQIGPAVPTAPASAPSSQRGPMRTKAACVTASVSGR